MPRNASDKTIRTAFRKTAKALHPDINACDPIAEQQLRQVIAAYEILKHPQRKADYDQGLAARDRKRRRELVRRFTAPAVAGLVSGSIVATVVWVSVSLSQMQDGFSPLQTLRSAVAKLSQPGKEQVAATDDDGGRREAGRGRKGDRDFDGRFPEQSASTLRPGDAHAVSKTRLAGEWEQVQASGDPRAIWAFVVRNPGASESALARLKLIGMIDTAEDVALLHLLRLVGTDAIAERAHQRLVALGAPAVARAEVVVADAPSLDSPLQAAVNEMIDAVNRPAVAKAESAVSHPPSSDPPLQAAVGETIEAAKPAVAKEESAVSGVPSANSPQASLRETIEPVNREPPAAHRAPERARPAAKRQATNHAPHAPHAPPRPVSSESRSTPATPAASGHVSTPLFGVGF